MPMQFCRALPQLEWVWSLTTKQPSAAELGWHNVYFHCLFLGIAQQWQRPIGNVPIKAALDDGSGVQPWKVALMCP